MENAYLEEIKAQLRGEIGLSAGSLFDKFPLKRYLEMLECYPDIAEYTYISPEVSRYAENILRESSEDALESYHKLLLVELISRNLTNIVRQEFLDTVK